MEEIFKNRKLAVMLDSDGKLTISKKSGKIFSKEETVSTYNLDDVIDIVPDKGGSSVAIAGKTFDLYLKMNKEAVAALVEKWEAIPKDYKNEVLFKKKKVMCYVTSNGYLVFRTKSGGLCPCGKTISSFCISMADVLLVDTHFKFLKGNTCFLSTVDHAIEINKIGQKTIKRLTEKITNSGGKISEMKSYKRSFRFCWPFKREIEYIYTTPMGVAHYYKKNTKSDFHFVPWDAVICAMNTKGCISKRMIVITDEKNIVTNCKFPASDVNKIVTYINSHVKGNAGGGTLFGRGENKVYVTDTHVLCIGNNKLQALPKPYEKGILVKKSWFSSIVSLDGFNVKVGRYAWKGPCCCTGKFYDAVTATPSRTLDDLAENHKF